MQVDDTSVPARVGRYDIVLPLGRGRRSRVLLARATGLGGFDRYVALKIATEDLRGDPGFAKALVDDAKRIANLRHNDVVPVYDVGEDPDHGVYVVTEYVPGESLAGLRRLAREKGETLPKGVELRILIDALAGVHAAHEHTDDAGQPLAIVHGGLSPRNVLVGTDGIARASDFGVASGAGTDAKDAYVAPEQARGEAADRKSDVWSAGVIAWEILTGGEARTWIDDPPRANVSADLDAAVANALRVDREQRTSSAAAFAKELAAAAREAGMLAETSAVAEHVNRLAGPALAERRERLAKAREGGSEVRTIIGMAAPPPPSRDKLPSLPEVPPAPVAVPDAPLTFLALKVDLGDVAADRASDAVLGASAQPASSAVEAEPAVYRSPVAPPVPPWRQKKIVVPVAAGAVVLVLILAFALRGSKSDAAGGVASATIASASGSVHTVDLDKARTLHITADGPIAKVAIGERVVDVVAAPAVDVELLEPERDKSIRVVVTGTDGRVATATADPGVRGLDVTLDPNALPPPPPPKSAAPAASSAPAQAQAHAAPAAPREKRTWPKRGPRK